MSRQTKSLSSKFLRGLNFFLLIVFAFLCVYPLYFIFINSISGADAVVRGVYILPEDFSLEFYKSLLQMPNIPNSIVVSVARTVLGTALTVICSSFLGYMVTQSELPMRKWVYRFVVATMYFNAGLIPWYILMVNLGLKNNFLLYILPSAVGAYYVVLSKTYIESIPASVEESAKIDGAGVLTIYARLILPMSMPIIACLIVFCAVNQWNAWSDNFYLVSDPKLSTLQYQLYQRHQHDLQLQPAALQGHHRARPALRAEHADGPAHHPGLPLYAEVLRKGHHAGGCEGIGINGPRPCCNTHHLRRVFS